MTTSIDPLIKKTFLEDGVVKLPRWLDADSLARLQALFDWCTANPGPNQSRIDDADSFQITDNSIPGAAEAFRETIESLPFAAVMREVWDSTHIWCFGEEVFWKSGTIGRTPWHQDTSYYPWGGSQYVNFWISFDAAPKPYGLEVIRGSFRGTLYDGTVFDPSDPTRPLWGDLADFPRLPDIEKERAADPDSWDAISYDIEPGDVVMLASGSLHGGAPTDARLPERRTLVLRFFGDDAVWSKRPTDTSRLGESAKVVDLDNHGTPGEPLRYERAIQLC